MVFFDGFAITLVGIYFLEFPSLLNLWTETDGSLDNGLLRGRIYSLQRCVLLCRNYTPMSKHIVFPRQVAMFLIREETASSLPAIGQAFGGRDHTTVLHSYEKINTESREDQRLQSDLRKIRELLYSH